MSNPFFNWFRKNKDVRTITVTVFNEERNAHYELVKELEEGSLQLVCPSCNSPVADQQHVDFTCHPHKRQTICVNGDCINRIHYRLE